MNSKSCGMCQHVLVLAACLRYSPALAATHALHDHVSAWRYATETWLGLHDPAAVRLMDIASCHLQQKATEAAATAEATAAALLMSSMLLVRGQMAVLQQMRSVSKQRSHQISRSRHRPGRPIVQSRVSCIRTHGATCVCERL
jgi:hypothetical protein